MDARSESTSASFKNMASQKRTFSRGHLKGACWYLEGAITSCRCGEEATKALHIKQKTSDDDDAEADVTKPLKKKLTTQAKEKAKLRARDKGAHKKALKVYVTVSVMHVAPTSSSSCDQQLLAALHSQMKAKTIFSTSMNANAPRKLILNTSHLEMSQDEKDLLILPPMSRKFLNFVNECIQKRVCHFGGVLAMSLKLTIDLVIVCAKYFGR